MEGPVGHAGSLNFVLNAVEGLTHPKTQLALLVSSSDNYFLLGEIAFGLVLGLSRD